MQGDCKYVYFSTYFAVYMNQYQVDHYLRGVDQLKGDVRRSSVCNQQGNLIYFLSVNIKLDLFII